MYYAPNICHLMNIGIYDDWFITCCHTHISPEFSAIFNTMQPLVAREKNLDSPAGWQWFSVDDWLPLDESVAKKVLDQKPPLLWLLARLSVVFHIFLQILALYYTSSRKTWNKCHTHWKCRCFDLWNKLSTTLPWKWTLSISSLWHTSQLLISL